MANSDKKSMLKKKILKFQRFYFDYMNWKLFDIYMSEPDNKDSLKILDEIATSDNSSDNYEQMIFPFLDEEEQLQVRLNELATPHNKVAEKDIVSLFTNIPKEFKNLFQIEVKNSVEKAPGYMADLKGFEINAICEALKLNYRAKGSKEINTQKIIDCFINSPEYLYFLFSLEETDIISYIIHIDLWQKNDYSVIPEHIIVMKEFESCIKKLMCLGLVNLTYFTDEENQTAYICVTEELSTMFAKLEKYSRALKMSHLKSLGMDKCLNEISRIIENIIEQ